MKIRILLPAMALCTMLCTTACNNTDKSKTDTEITSDNTYNSDDNYKNNDITNDNATNDNNNNALDDNIDNNSLTDDVGNAANNIAGEIGTIAEDVIDGVGNTLGDNNNTTNN